MNDTLRRVWNANRTAAAASQRAIPTGVDMNAVSWFGPKFAAFLGPAEVAVRSSQARLNQNRAAPGTPREKNVKLSMRSAVGVLSLLAGLCLAGPDLHVMRDGDAKVFQSSIGQRELKGVANSGSWTKLEGHPLGDGWFRNYSSGGDSWIIQWRGYYEGLIKTNAAAGESWNIDANDACLQPAVATMASVGSTVTVPAGTFDDCVMVTFVGNCADGGTQSVTFAPDVGIIAWTEQSIMGPRTFELQSAQIGGAVYPVPFEGIKVSTRLNDVAFQAGPTARIEISGAIINDSPDAVTLIHSSGQLYDATITDLNGSGMILSQWSHGRFFTMAFVNKTIAPGDTLSYDFSMDVKDNAGNNLPAGTYVLTWWSTGNKAFGGKTTFTVDP